MNNIDQEKLIDDIANRIKSGRDVSVWQRNHHTASLTRLMTDLAMFPKAKLPRANLSRIRNQILDRISIPEDIKVVNERAGFWVSIPGISKMVLTVAGSLLILVSLGIGTAVSALQSVPGQPIYPLKKIVENIQLKLTSDPSARANLQIQFATNRLNELSTVIEKNQAGEISTEEAQKIVASTVKDLQQTTAAALSTTSASNTNPKVSTLTKLVDLSNKQQAVLQPLLSAATVKNEGSVKIVLQEALQTSISSKEQAIKNIENAGLKVEDQPISISDTSKVTANGKITAVTSDSLSVGTAKFLLTKDTEYVNIKATDLKADVAVEISGEVRSDNKTYALLITGLDQPEANPTTTDTKTPDTESKTSN